MRCGTSPKGWQVPFTLPKAARKACMPKGQVRPRSPQGHVHVPNVMLEDLTGGMMDPGPLHSHGGWERGGEFDQTQAQLRGTALFRRGLKRLFFDASLESLCFSNEF